MRYYEGPSHNYKQKCITIHYCTQQQITNVFLYISIKIQKVKSAGKLKWPIVDQNAHP